ncbi:MAG: hypothetical protein IJS12_08005 [Lachnospiraceae bacterium]|nr:hypothetical protein [Lachnospiraceae bacterium]
MSSGWSAWGNDDITDRNAPVNNPITSFNFVLEVEGVYFLALKSVKVFNKENEYEYIREGGVNDYVHMRRKPISKPFTFQVERYVGTERFLDPLANGTELMLPVMLYVYRHKARSEIIDAAPASPARIYTFTGCVVTAKEYGELNSEKSAILTETTTIAYRELMVVTNPFEGSQELPAWEFPHDKSKHIFPENKYANTGSLSNDKNIYVKKEDAALDGKPVWQRNDDAWSFDTNSESTNKPFWSIRGIEGHSEQYADQTSALWSMGTYETGEDGYTTRVDSEAKQRQDSYKKDGEIKWGNGTNMNASEHYSRQDDGSWKMTDSSAKPRAEEIKAGDKVKYANQSNETSSDHYTPLGPGEGGWESTDITAKKRQEKYDGSKPTYADSTNAVSDDHYTPKPKEGGWEMSDGTAKPRWDIKANKTDPKPENAIPAFNGDTPPTVMKPWDIRANKKDPKPTYAKPAVNGDGLQPAKTPWDIKANKENPKPTYAKPAPNGDVKQTPVTWPPTRRALMAESLSKK